MMKTEILYLQMKCITINDIRLTYIENIQKVSTKKWVMELDNQNEEIKINLIVNNKTFSATLENNNTTKELVSMFTMTLNMSELNSNEKYHLS